MEAFAGFSTFIKIMKVSRPTLCNSSLKEIQRILKSRVVETATSIPDPWPPLGNCKIIVISWFRVLGRLRNNNASQTIFSPSNGHWVCLLLFVVILGNYLLIDFQLFRNLWINKSENTEFLSILSEGDV